MRKTFTNLTICAVVLLLSAINVFAQTQLSGTITDAVTKEPLIGVSVQVKGKVIGTISDIKGKFSLSTSTPPPFQLIVTSVGFQTQTIDVTGSKSNFEFVMKEQATLGQEVVVSASRVQESELKSPVTVEKMDIRGMRETPSASFYDGLANMKGIDMTTQSLLFKSINMRGFGATGNPRTVQMIDGMDNSAPGLNFPVDNIVGMPELDVESVEILPGAASALYGPNALNGLVLMNSKSPFLYQGLSATVKTGVMNEPSRPTPTTGFYDGAIRYAKAINNKFAFKINLGYIQAKDWQSTNYNNLNTDTRNPAGAANPLRGLGTNPDYDGMNVYGDEVQANMQTVADALISARLIPAAARALVPNVNVSRTGYIENALIDNGIKSFKFNGAVHYRLSEKIEAVAQVNYGLGTTMYTGTGKYSLKDFSLTQAKLELKGDNFTLRAYTTQERSGNSYTAGLAAVGMLNEIKPHATWFGEYVGNYVGARSLGQSDADAAITARKVADKDMPMPGSAQFNTLLNKYSTTSIAKGGGSFLDKTNLYHIEGVYNLKNQIKFMELLVGANYRQFQLRSEGTLFADTKDGRNGSIAINEYGAFAQAGKSLFSDHLKITASMRYDKNQNFEGQFSPRISAVASFGQSNVRLSYQTGFRIPTTQNQYIDLQTPGGTLIGGLPEFNSRYNLNAGVLRETLVDFATNPAKYVTADVLAKAQAYATAAVNAQLSAITAGVTNAVTTIVTSQVNAAVAAGQIPAAAAAAVIKQNVDAAVPGEVAKEVRSQVTRVTTQVAPAYALATLQKYQPKDLTPERIKSIEIGYKGLIGKKIFLDASYYNSVYQNFIGGVTVVVPTAAAAPGLPLESGLASGTTRAGYSRPANTANDITVSGFAIGINVPLEKGFSIGGNFAQNNLTDFQKSAELPYDGFNTPTNRYNINFGKRLGSGDKVGFNIAFKHQTSFFWQTSFDVPTTNGIDFFTNTLVPEVNNIDAQVSVKWAAMKTIVKIGGTNILGTPYIQAYGSPTIGSMYYVSLSFDNLLNR